jgi:hypothetical protein
MPYTPIISADDLKTHQYAATINEITRNDGSIITKGISTAVAEAKMFLSRYDLVAMFGSAPDDLAATFADDYLLSLVKDLAIYHITKLGKTNVYSENIRAQYDDAVGTLKLIQKGQANPEWPYVNSTTTTAPDTDAITIIANPKRNNYY